MTHRPIWGGCGRLCWGRCPCGWQSAAYRATADVQRSYAAHLSRLLCGTAAVLDSRGHGAAHR
jgi:hypothetical protein